MIQLSESPRKAIALDAEQEKALTAAEKGQNLIITGPAGTGKSTLLEEMKVRFKGSLFTTASTGVAAVNVGGVTLHSFAGLLPVPEGIDAVINRINTRNVHALENILSCEKLAIDEISMIDGHLLEKLDLLFKAVRRSNDPFGGVQMILFGDFLQLPPISRDGAASFAFQSSAWKNAGIEKVNLTHVFRQEHRPFAEALSYLRVGDTSHPSYELIESRIGATPPAGSKPLRLFSHNSDVDEINLLELQKIPGESSTYYAEGKGSKKHLDNIRKYCLAPEELELKIGAQVMLLVNLDQDRGLVNGSIGHVTALGPSEVRVRFLNGQSETIETDVWQIAERSKTVATWEQIPLRLAFCTTVHKSQGVTLDFMECDLGRTWEFGQAYVALSRAKNLEGLYIKQLSRNCIRAHPDAVKFYES